VVGLFLNFKIVSITINVVLSSFFLMAIVFKLFLALVGSRFELFQAVTKEEVRNVVDDELPIYTIHLPVYKEDKLIKKLIWNLQSLDYPAGEAGY
jgi:cellulose synthase/poly-beta-1,6-N-acetylglucosamine synthase-like glycosyltransferase